MANSSNDLARAGLPQTLIAIGATFAIVIYLLWQPLGLSGSADGPLLVALVFGGGYLVFGLLGKLFRGQFGSDLLAGLSIITAVLLGQYLAGTLVVLMLSGGEALEAYAVRRASSALEALARRMPSVAHRSRQGTLVDVALADIAVGDLVVVFPHETCPVDGIVVDGHGTMDESYLTGEPYMLAKAPGSATLSGAVNGDSALTIRAERLAEDSRYAKILHVMRESEQRRPRLRRLGDQLGALYTPLAVAIALAAGLISRDPVRFLAVLVVATPCPLLIAIPVAIIGAVSLSARRGIVIKDPAVLETVTGCKVAIFDKTGTLTCGRPKLVEIIPTSDFTAERVLQLTASLERYSRHPLAGAILDAAEAARLQLLEVSNLSEMPGKGLVGTVEGRSLRVTGRSKLLASEPGRAAELPPVSGGLECIILIDNRVAGTARFRDRPRDDSKQFIRHLGAKHHFERVLLVSGDRENEVKYLADAVGITEIYAGQMPEEKVAIARRETAANKTVYVGDGINDAPALTACTVGIAFGQNSDVTAEAAGAVILDADLRRVDEFLHISQRLRAIALQSAVGGMILSLGGMLLAAAGLLPPVAGAITQEVIDVAAVLNALRITLRPRSLTDY
ncbi:MAG: heavy metal translocating P-type ATPase [Gemmataceae bacterium]|nr:heavy metal translocating P-type ATPase [Gemmataceae bacterium]